MYYIIRAPLSSSSTNYISGSNLVEREVKITGPRFFIRIIDKRSLYLLYGLNN